MRYGALRQDPPCRQLAPPHAFDFATAARSSGAARAVSWAHVRRAPHALQESQAHVSDDPCVEPLFREVSGWVEGGWIERLPIGSRGFRGRVRATLEASAISALPRPDVIWTSAIEVAVPASLVPVGCTPPAAGHRSGLDTGAAGGTRTGVLRAPTEAPHPPHDRQIVRTGLVEHRDAVHAVVAVGGGFTRRQGVPDNRIQSCRRRRS